MKDLRARWIFTVGILFRRIMLPPLPPVKQHRYKTTGRVSVYRYNVVSPAYLSIKLTINLTVAITCAYITIIRQS